MKIKYKTTDAAREYHRRKRAEYREINKTNREKDRLFPYSHEEYEYKRCYKCGRILHISNFRRDSGCKDGLNLVCTECFHAYLLEWQKRKWKNDAKYREMKNSCIQRFYKRNKKLHDDNFYKNFDYSQLKFCKKCKTWHTYDNFHKDACRTDGFFYACKLCTSKKWQIKKIENEIHI